MGGRASHAGVADSPPARPRGGGVPPLHRIAAVCSPSTPHDAARVHPRPRGCGGNTRGGGGCTVARGAAALLAKSGQAAPGWGLPPVPSGGGVARPDGCAAAAVPRASAPRTPRLSPPLPATPPIHQQSSLCTSARRAAVGGTVAPGRAARPAQNAGGSARGGAIPRRPMASRRTQGGGPMAATKRAPRFLLSFAWRPPGVGPAPPLPAARGVAGCSRRGPPQTNPVRLRLARRRGSSG